MLHPITPILSYFFIITITIFIDRSMNVYNSSHLLWEQIGCDETVEPVVEGGVIDSFWLVQHNHGPFTNK